MKKIKWGSKFNQQCDHAAPIPTVEGYKFGNGETSNIRLFQYSGSGEWGVQVTMMRATRAKSLESAKRKAAKLIREMGKDQ